MTVYQQSCSLNTKCFMFDDRPKHLDVTVNSVRDCIEAMKVGLPRIATKDNPTDMLTKPITKAKCMDLVGINSLLWISLSGGGRSMRTMGGVRDLVTHFEESMDRVLQVLTAFIK